MTATVPHSPPVVLITEELAPSVLEVLGDDVEVRHVDGTDRSALLPALAEAAAVLIRSATRIDAEALAAAPNLAVVARAGIGLDNVDVEAATARGVMVVNAPTSNVVSAAEHAVALLLAAARQIPAADATLRAGRWQRSSFMGVELAGDRAPVERLDARRDGRRGRVRAVRRNDGVVGSHGLLLRLPPNLAIRHGCRHPISADSHAPWLDRSAPLR